MDAVTSLSILSCVLIVLTGACFLYQTVYLIVPFFLKKRPKKEGKLHRYAILIAARNEEAVLPHLLQSIAAQEYPPELLQVYVVADNCSDRTAQIAQEYGAQVFQRFNKLQVGKGYALNYLLEQIDQGGGLDRYDAFLVFDADNLLLPDYILQMDRVVSDGYQAFCGYRNTKNFGDNWISSGYGLWYLHESTHLNRSRMALGNCCAVSGTGFGFTTGLLRSIGSWNFFTLTEDIEFSVWCATRGIQIGYCHDAVLFDEQPTTFHQSWRQRTRWAQGGIQVSTRYARQYLRGIRRGGKMGYSSFEMLTLSLWGFGFSMASGLITGLTLALRFPQLPIGAFLLCSLVLGYATTTFMGGLTLLLEHRRIRATKLQKIRSVFTFPLFMMTWLPITLAAPFQKFGWPPIAHTVAISASTLQKH